MGWKVKEVQPTPNPNAMKLILDGEISSASVSFFNAAAAANDSLARQLFSIKGVNGLLLLNDFVTVNKTPEAKWNGILPKVKEMLEKFPATGR